MYNGNYIIVFEGVDGSGKTTQCKRLMEHLTKNNVGYIYGKARVKPTSDYIFLCEVETNNFGQFPKWLKSSVMAYERAKQIYTTLNSIKNGIVIFDKYIYSTPIYLDYVKIDDFYANMFLKWLPQPDLLFNFQGDIDECLSRIKKRGAFNQNENFEFLDKLQKELPSKYKKHGDFKVVDILATDLSEEAIEVEINENVYELFNRKDLK